MTREEILREANPILFNTEMVKAILDDRKTVTRRVVKLPRWGYFDYDPPWGLIAPCSPGDYLYVRETWCQRLVSPGGNFRPNGVYYYKSDGDLRPEAWKGNWIPSIHMPKKAARLFLMVKDVRVERLQDITEAGAIEEGIPEDWPMDSVYCPVCKGEGLIGTYRTITLGYTEVECPHCEKAVARFKNLWNSTVKKADLSLYGWEANPWVWVIEFERVVPE